MTRLVPQCDGIIAISSFLEKFYSDKGKKTIRIPALIDTDNHSTTERRVNYFDSKMLNLIYAGIPGKKDLLHLIIKSVSLLNKNGYFICLHILGLSSKELLRLYGVVCQKGIVCYGKVNQQEVKSFLERADFSILLRPSKRYANAGFPTKFVESLNAGLPVIANYTSDLQQYLIDGYNGFVVNGYTEELITDKLQKVFKQGRSVWDGMRLNALRTAKINFDYKLYTRQLVPFMSEMNSWNENNRIIN